MKHSQNEKFFVFSNQHRMNIWKMFAFYVAGLAFAPLFVRLTLTELFPLVFNFRMPAG